MQRGTPSERPYYSSVAVAAAAPEAGEQGAASGGARPRVGRRARRRAPSAGQPACQACGLAGGLARKAADCGEQQAAGAPPGRLAINVQCAP